MAFDVNWGIGEAVDVGGMVRQGFERGRVERDQRLQRNALATYAQDPNPQNLNALAPYQPEFVLRERERQNEIQQAQQRRDLTGRAAMGDSDAMGQLAGIDVDTWMKLDDRTRQRVKQGTEFMGQAVLQVSQLPEQQRAQAWASLVQQAEAGGMDIPPQYERYSPQALNAAAAEAGTMQKMLEQFEPDWHLSPNGGMVNFRDPQSIRDYSAWMAKGGPAATAPPPATLPPDFDFGTGGPTQPASGGFRP
jgi:hypothetical protein